MITWVTVWVLTIYNYEYETPFATQQTYATQQVCEKRAEYYNKSRNWIKGKCDFQQVPVYVPKGGSK